MKAYLDLAYEYEARNVLVVIGEYIWNREVIPPAEQWHLAVDALQTLGKYAAELGLEIVVELEPFVLSLVNDIDTMVKLLDDVGHPAVKANIDISHLVLSKVKPEELRRLKGGPATCTSRTAMAKCTASCLRPRRGAVRAVLAEIKALGIDGVFRSSWSIRPIREHIVQWVQEAYRETDKLMQAVGLRS